MKKHLLNITASVLVALSLSNCSSSTTNPVTGNNTTNTSTASTVNYKVAKTITVGKTPHGMWQAGGFVYNSNIGEGTISVIDTKTDTVVKTITINDGVPGYAKAFHDSKNILITDTKKGELMVIDPAQEHKIIQTIPLGTGPDKIRISEDDKTAFISLTGEDKIIALTFDTDRSKAPARKEFKVGAMPKDAEHRTVAITNEWLATPNIADNDVSLVNISSGTEKRLKDGNNPAVVDIGLIAEKATNVIVGNTASNTVTIFDINSDNKKTITDAGLAPTDSSSYQDMTRTFITMAGSDDVAVIDYSTKTLLKRIPVGKRPVHIYNVSSENGLSVKHEGIEDTEMWIGNDSGDSVSVIDPVTLKVKITIPVGKGHHKMAFTSDKAYISNITDNTVTVINRK